MLWSFIVTTINDAVSVALYKKTYQLCLFSYWQFSSLHPFVLYLFVCLGYFCLCNWVWNLQSYKLKCLLRNCADEEKSISLIWLFWHHLIISYYTLYCPWCYLTWCQKSATALFFKTDVMLIYCKLMMYKGNTKA